MSGRSSAVDRSDRSSAGTGLNWWSLGAPSLPLPHRYSCPTNTVAPSISLSCSYESDLVAPPSKLPSALLIHRYINTVAPTDLCQIRWSLQLLTHTSLRSFQQQGHLTDLVAGQNLSQLPFSKSITGRTHAAAALFSTTRGLV